MTISVGDSPDRGFFGRDEVFYPLCGLLAASAIFFRWLGLPFLTHDMQDDLLPWFDYIVTHGRFGALSDNFYGYTPAYICFMMTMSYLDGIFERITLIKSMSILFDFIAAFLVFKLAMMSRPDTRRSVLLALLFLNLPTVILNGSFWGQFDIIYSTFMLAFVYCLIRNRPYQAMSMYALAFAVKLQAILLAPILIYLFFSGLVPLAAFLLIPLVYLLVILPAVLAGRPWIDMLTVYGNQIDIPNKLSARAPNIYVVIQHFLPVSYFPTAVIVGVLVAGIVSLIVLSTHFRVRRPPPTVFIVVAATLWVALEPALLPKMHERYFLTADVFAFVMAVFIPRAWWTAVLLQIGSILSYSYFMAIDHDVPFDLHPTALIGAFAEIPATLGIGWYYWRIVKASGATDRRDVNAPGSGRPPILLRWI
jgi:Gpi18-like mannosyltransferase